MAPSHVTNADVFTIWCRMKTKRQIVRVATAKFRVWQNVHISKEE